MWIVLVTALALLAGPGLPGGCGIAERRLPMRIVQSRRGFLTNLSAAGAASIGGARPSLADEPPPEVTTIRLRRDPAICVAPQYIAEDLLRAEGFSEIRYVPELRGLPTARMLARGEIDFVAGFTAASAVFRLESGVPMTVLAGLHAGCFELFAHDPIRTISDLKGKKVGIDILGSAKHLYLAIMAAHVGLDPQRDIEWSRVTLLIPRPCFLWSCSSNERSTRFSGSHRNRRRCAPARSAG
jgi:NitT/TauT family transport system substrate-binding protein